MLIRSWRISKIWSIWRLIMRVEESLTLVRQSEVRITCLTRTSEAHGSNKIRKIKWRYKPSRDRIAHKSLKMGVKAQHRSAVLLRGTSNWKHSINQQTDSTPSSSASQWLQALQSTTSTTKIAPWPQKLMEHAQESGRKEHRSTHTAEVRSATTTMATWTPIYSNGVKP